MSFILTLHSNSSLIEQSYFPPIVLDGTESWTVGLIHFSSYHSIPNVDETNNKITVGSHNIVLPEGAYELEEINEYVVSELKKLDPEQTIIIRGNNNTLRTEIKSTLPVKVSSLGRLLGYEKREILEPNILHLSDSMVRISKIHEVRVECNIARGSYINGTRCNSIFGFDIEVPPGYKLSLTPQTVIYHPVTVSEIDFLSLRIVDQDGKLINFRNEHVTVRLHLKKIS